MTVPRNTIRIMNKPTYDCTKKYHKNNANICHIIRVVKPELRIFRKKKFINAEGTYMYQIERRNLENRVFFTVYTFSTISNKFLEIKKLRCAKHETNT